MSATQALTHEDDTDAFAAEFAPASAESCYLPSLKVLRDGRERVVAAHAAALAALYAAIEAMYPTEPDGRSIHAAPTFAMARQVYRARIRKLREVADGLEADRLIIENDL